MTYSQENPSPAYRVALREAQTHHRIHKTWNGGLMSRHLGPIRALARRLHCKDALDYGCGKCAQYLATTEEGLTAEEFLGFEVYKMDPAVPADFRRPPDMPADYKIATTLPPDRQWDLVIVTHVLGSIPLVDLRDWVVPLLHSRARKAIYLAENLNKPKKDKGVFSTVAEKPREWTADQWMELLQLPGSEVKVEGWFRGTPGNNPRESGDDGPGFSKWRAPRRTRRA